jgi:hypothetical protein
MVLSVQFSVSGRITGRSNPESGQISGASLVFKKGNTGTSKDKLLLDIPLYLVKYVLL